MRPFRTHKLLSRALAVVVMAATVMAAPLGSLAAADCVGCGTCGERAGCAAAPTEREDCCCAAGEADGAPANRPASSESSKQSPGDDERCPAGCTQCCLTQGRLIVPAERGVAVRPDVQVWVGVATPATAPPAAGVHESVFHPPKV